MPIVGETTTRELTEEEKRRWSEHEADTEWMLEHWGEMLERYAGKCIAIANQELFIGDDLREVYEQARAKYPERTPLVEYILPYKGKWIR